MANVELSEAQQSGDLGREVILQGSTVARMFEVSSDTQFLYDDNILLAPSDSTNAVRLSDGVVFQTFNASFSPQLLPKLRSTMYLRYQLVRYEHHDELDFDGQTAGLNLSYPLANWLAVSAGWSANRLVQDVDDRAFYEEYDTVLGLQVFKVIGSRALVFAGYQFDWRPASPSQFNRFENAGYLGLNYVLIQKLSAQCLYRLRFGQYYEDDREDLENLLSFTLGYAFNEYVALRAYVQYAHGDSNQALFDYEVVNVGGGLNLSFRF